MQWLRAALRLALLLGGQDLPHALGQGRAAQCSGVVCDLLDGGAGAGAGAADGLRLLQIKQRRVVVADKPFDKGATRDPRGGAGLLSSTVEKVEASNIMEKVNVVEATNDSDATCNDGTPGVYYWSPAPSDGEPRSWLVFLEGGGWCWDAASCAPRGGDSVSSAHHPSLQVNDRYGILGSLSPVRGFNRVYIRHCSSDAWMGDIGANATSAGVNWRGARILRATLRHLVDARGLAGGDFMLFGGASAGARGAMVHLDTLQPQGLVPAGVKLLGFLDSPYWLDTPAFQDLTQVEHRFPEQTKQVVLNMQNEAIVSGAGLCELDDVWKCAFGEYRLPMLKTPFMLFSSQYDWFRLIIAQVASVTPSDCFPEPQCSYYDYADSGANATRQKLLVLPQVIAGTSGVYSSTCYDHAMSIWKEFNLQRVLGVTMAEALSAALEATGSPNGSRMPVVVDASCGQFNCGSGCMKKLDSTCGCSA
eukprot:CAMPEP_0204124972 /NCGR_PEP_ID=MMETSP0361-20130328/10155_1 /ASSEMBLY_ACC=CAM_ASM_000343 /TAXON_ID=268821 /ORGANISM="Scrippsiella Hangoei, Strain SHTV-5" /LENGTH=475 /DNA_ID=CAMNT_0051076609 /DNA_START=49 /DNA_END=1476 /DNA_ORIENTATION=-